MIRKLLKHVCAKDCHNKWSSDKAIAKIKRCSFFCFTWWYMEWTVCASCIAYFRSCIFCVSACTRVNVLNTSFVAWSQYSQLPIFRTATSETIKFCESRSQPVNNGLVWRILISSIANTRPIPLLGLCMIEAYTVMSLSANTVEKVWSILGGVMFSTDFWNSTLPREAAW